MPWCRPGRAHVDANFKEVQLPSEGGTAGRGDADLYGGEVAFHGRVEGFSGGTGAGSPPSRPRTHRQLDQGGQRLPVRIALDPGNCRHPLRGGAVDDATIDSAERELESEHFDRPGSTPR